MGLSSTPRTWVAGEVVTAVEMNTEVRDAITGIQAAWTTWTPTVASGLTVGNGTWTGSYLQVGKDIKARFSFTLGSTSAVSAPLLLFPIAVATSYIPFMNCGSASLYDLSATTTGRLPAVAWLNSTSSSGVGSFGIGTTGGQLSSTNPFTWATGDIISATLTYEAA